MKNADRVAVWTDEVILPTYLPAAPDRSPMFLEKRVYQGSSGRVYPLPFTDRIAEQSVDRAWKAVWLENEFLRVLVLPEIGGRIHLARDKTNGYDFIYRQSVIKPALVGLAGPWISGGIELNWPQHHRPATFLPVDVRIEAHSDGSKTVWCGDHDPLTRMKGMHGVCLHPGRADLELKVRVFNRTPWVQTFLWWANVATRVHEAYQSFFPPDVSSVADHARRAVSEYPLCKGRYYGVNYGERKRSGTPAEERPPGFVPPNCGGRGPVNYPPNDLGWYANIPVPTSYMCLGSQADFFGGYDHFAQAGVVHVASHHFAPGKKQWTWGNHHFGYAWDRNLTDADGPYIELMAGVYTDNQPDFSFLQPGETRTWSQYWYPIRQIGVPQAANLEAAVSLQEPPNARTGGARGCLRVGVAVSRRFDGVRIALEGPGRTVAGFTADLSPDQPFVREVKWPEGLTLKDLALHLTSAEGREIITYQPVWRRGGARVSPATEPPPPEKIGGTDELYVTGLHLEQYRHATRCPTPYWREALRRDPFDARCNHALGLWHLRRGEWTEAEGCFRKAIERLTLRNPNPRDGEPYYSLGLCLRYRLDQACPAVSSGALFDASYAAFYKATWNQAWAAAGFHALAEMDCRKRDWTRALEHLDRSLRFDTDDTRTRDLKAIVLRELGRDWEAGVLIRATLALDPLDWWARHLSGERPACDNQVLLDIAHDCARAGLYEEGAGLLEFARYDRRDLPDQGWGTAPLVCYTLGWLRGKLGNMEEALACCRRASSAPVDYCFPARLEEIAVLKAAAQACPDGGRAPYLLGNLLYDRRRHDEAIRLWERSARLDPDYPVVWRNLGIGYFNVRGEGLRARRAYERAFRADPRDARLLYERDQLWKRLGERPGQRLAELEKHLELVKERDDLSVELCALYNQTGQPGKALEILRGRRFQPWEGGEGQALGQDVRTQVALGREALAAQDPGAARDHFEKALAPPDNLGEAWHLLANRSVIRYWLGVACSGLGERKAAREHWRSAATFLGDFQEMSVRPYSEMTYYSALAWRRLGREAEAKNLLRELLAYARQLGRTEARIDYFATSLPTMLLFDDDLQKRQQTTALFLQAQAWLGLGAREKARRLLQQVLRRDPNHALAADLRGEA